MKTNFNLNVSNGAIVAVDYIMQKPSGLVAVGEVLNGNVSTGDRVTIQANGKEPIPDKIIRIELFYQAIKTATDNQRVGILLKNTSKAALLQYFG